MSLRGHSYMCTQSYGNRRHQAERPHEEPDLKWHMTIQQFQASVYTCGLKVRMWQLNHWHSSDVPFSILARVTHPGT
jgi:hypothetical protein